MKRIALLLILIATMAHAADVTIDGTVNSATARGLRSMVFTTNSIGYSFYLDSSGAFVYSKTTDGGATWGAAVTINGNTTNIAFDVWFDKWTTGDSGTKIHTWWFSSTGTNADTVIWRTLDTNGDSLGTAVNVFAGASAVAGIGAMVSGAKTESGYLYAFYNIDGGTEFGFNRSTDSGATWSADLGGTFNEGSTDRAWLFPAHGTGDNNDLWAFYWDASANSYTMKMWDSSAAAQVESSSIVTTNLALTDLTSSQYPASGAIRQSDGHLIMVGMTERDLSTTDMMVWDISAVTSGSQTGITVKTNITTNIDDIFNPAICINQNNNDIYVAYNGKRDGSEVIGTTTKVYYTKSTDGGGTWSAGDTAYEEGATAVINQVWAPITGPRFYASWRQGTTTLVGNSVNSVIFVLPSTSIKTVMGLAEASVKTVNNLARASVKTIMELP